VAEGPLAGIRVVVVNSFPGPGMGGGEVLTLAIVDALTAAGADVKAVVLPVSDFGDAVASRGLGVERAPLWLEHLPAALHAIRGAAGAGAVLFGTGYWSNLLVRAARRRGGDRVLNLVGVMPSAAGGSALAKALRRLADRATIARVDAFAASAPAIAAELEALGAPADRIRVIPNAIDPDAIRAAGERPLPTGFPAQGPVIACVARLETVKGVEFLLRALPKVPGASLALAGVGSLAAPLRALAGDLGIAGRVRFLGWVPDATPVLRAATVVALPSLAEGLPLVALEALALEKPVVATAVGGTPEAIEDGVTGRLVPPADPEALAAALRELLADPAHAAALAAAGRRRVDERFSVRTLGPAYVELVANVARGDSPA
jgi:glycosyltransferase involved in cell wall biosynthesis